MRQLFVRPASPVALVVMVFLALWMQPVMTALAATIVISD